MGFGEHQVDAGQGGCPPGEIGPATPPGALEGPAGLVTSRRDARHQGQRRGHGRQRQAAGSDLRRSTAVRGGGHQAFRGPDDGSGVLCGTGQFGCAPRVEQLPGRDGPGVRVEERLRDHDRRGPLRFEEVGPFEEVSLFEGVSREDLDARIVVAAEQGIQSRAALGQRGLHDDRGGILVRVGGSGQEPGAENGRGRRDGVP